MASKAKASTKIPAAVGTAMYEVWLAGLGALSQAQREGRKQFESLVAEGMAIQERVRTMAQSQIEAGARQMIEAAQAATEKAQGSWEEFQGAVQGHLERLMASAPGGKDMQAFMKRLQAASVNLQSLAKWPGNGDAPMPMQPAKKAAKKKSAKKAAKAPAKKAAKAPAKKAAKKKAAKRL